MLFALVSEGRKLKAIEKSIFIPFLFIHEFHSRESSSAMMMVAQESERVSLFMLSDVYHDTDDFWEWLVDQY